jgi:DNA-binding Xre family transcriptional regulator
MSTIDVGPLVPRIKQHMADKKLSPAEFAESADIDRPNLHKILSGKTKTIHIETLRKILSVLEPNSEGVPERERLAAIVLVDRELGEEELQGLLRMQQFLKRPIKISEIPDILPVVLSKES